MKIRNDDKIIPPEIMIDAYLSGAFPMAESRSAEHVHWYTTKKRGVFPLDQFHMPRRVLRHIKTKGYSVRYNTSFREVVEGCANRNKTWINQRIINTFCHLNRLGLAHSVEVWRHDILCGGLYGMQIGRAFFAESVFQTEPECMKAALHFTHQFLTESDMQLWDVQFSNPFLKTFGCLEISNNRYMSLLMAATSENSTI